MMWMRTAVLGVAAGLAAFAVAAAPAPPRKAAADPPPPASLEIRDVEAWATAYLDRDMWTLITHDIEGATHPRQGPEPPGLVEAEVRTELPPVKVYRARPLARWSVD